jgi:hypothetical protein
MKSTINSVVGSLSVLVTLGCGDNFVLNGGSDVKDSIQFVENSKWFPVAPNDDGWAVEYELARFTISNSKPKCLVLRNKISRFTGILGGVKVENLWQSAVTGLSAYRPYLLLPEKETGEKLIVLIRKSPAPNELVGPWRMWDVTGYSSMKDLKLPSVKDLPQLGSRKDGDSYTSAIDVASKWVLKQREAGN